VGENGRIAWRSRRAGRHMGKGGMAILGNFRILLIVGGVFWLAGFSLVVTSFGSDTASTTSIPAGPAWYLYYEFNVLGGGHLRGDYVETTGGTVDLFVLNEVQYASYRTGMNVGSLWSLGSSKAGTIDVQLPSSGKYFLVADHGTPYERVPQVVRFSLHLTGIDPTTFAAGAGLLGAGVVVFSLGLRKWNGTARQPSVPPQTPSQPQPEPPISQPSGPQQPLVRP
jgi:hypothetical protein